MHVAESALGLMVDGGAVLAISGIDGGGVGEAEWTTATSGDISNYGWKDHPRPPMMLKSDTIKR